MIITWKGRGHMHWIFEQMPSPHFCFKAAWKKGGHICGSLQYNNIVEHKQQQVTHNSSSQSLHIALFPRPFPFLYISLRNFSSCEYQHLFTVFHVPNELNCLQENKVPWQAIAKAHADRKHITTLMAEKKIMYLQLQLSELQTTYTQ